MTMFERVVEVSLITAVVVVVELLTGVEMTKGIVLLLATAYVCDWKERS